MPIKTKRLLLRPFEESDQIPMIQILRNQEIRKTFMLPVFPDDAAAGEVFDYLLSQSHSEQHFVRGVFLCDNLIGFLNDVEVQDRTIELGYVIHPDYQGKGFATEALSASILELFQQGYSAVEAGYFEENPASGRVMEKCSMNRIPKTEDIPYRGSLHRCLYYKIENPLRPLGDSISYLPAGEQPLSAEVYFVRGKSDTYLYDVGNSEQSLALIRALQKPPTAVLSHYHADHTGNATKTQFAEVYVGDVTYQKLHFGTVVTEARTLEEGITVIPCPSVHTPGSLILNVRGEYCLLGDLFFHRGNVPMDLAQKMIIILEGIDTKYFVFSHGAAQNIYPKNVFLTELRKELYTRNQETCR